MKRILVAGGGGFIGGWLVKELLSQGNQVSAIDNKPLDVWSQVFPEAPNKVSRIMSLAIKCLTFILPQQSRGHTQTYRNLL